MKSYTFKKNYTLRALYKYNTIAHTKHVIYQLKKKNIDKFAVT